MARRQQHRGGTDIFGPAPHLVKHAGPYTLASCVLMVLSLAAAVKYPDVAMYPCTISVLDALPRFEVQQVNRQLVVSLHTRVEPGSGLGEVFRSADAIAYQVANEPIVFVASNLLPIANWRDQNFEIVPEGHRPGTTAISCHPIRARRDTSGQYELRLLPQNLVLHSVEDRAQFMRQSYQVRITGPPKSIFSRLVPPLAAKWTKLRRFFHHTDKEAALNLDQWTDHHPM